MNPIIDIPMDAREDTEQLGSKPKFWVLLDDKRWLFKEARPNTGEDWSEKAAAEIAKALGIRAATVELAQYGDKRGCISLNFVDVNAGEALVHGNEILALRVTGYDKEKTFRQSDHTLENIDAAIRGLFHADRAEAILTELAGYMVLDALIGNTDRHHENWGLLAGLQSDPQMLRLSVAPSFDHASSLGRELQDERRRELLTTDRVRWYVEKGRGGMFRGPNERHGENPLRFVQVAARAYPVFFRPALDRVAALTSREVKEIFDALPDERASNEAKSFAQAMVLSAQASLTEILK
ncbi:MAG: HipA domain-containing protein [Hydrogenophaga sp.]|nr:HipA domain-containing protein [Hydrogenophaga sp.]